MLMPINLIKQENFIWEKPFCVASFDNELTLQYVCHFVLCFDAETLLHFNIF